MQSGADELIQLQTHLQTFKIDLYFNDTYKEKLKGTTYLRYEGDFVWWIGEEHTNKRIMQAADILHRLHQYCYEQKNFLLDKRSVTLIDVPRAKVNMTKNGLIETLTFKLLLFIPIL